MCWSIIVAVFLSLVFVTCYFLLRHKQREDIQTSLRFSALATIVSLLIIVALYAFVCGLIVAFVELFRRSVLVGTIVASASAILVVDGIVEIVKKIREWKHV